MIGKLRTASRMLKEHGLKDFLLYARYVAVLDMIRLLTRSIRWNSDRDVVRRTMDAFVRSVNGMERPRILELGSRNISRRNLFKPEADYVGFDINAGPCVDVVGDVHELGNHFPPGSFDAVFSVSVFEHLANPWKAVNEINKVLKEGGLFFTFTHPTFPEHVMPWDFWRYTRSSFAVLLNHLSGFRLLECEQGLPCVVVPLDDERTTRKTHRVLCFMGITALATKIGAAESSFEWKLDVAGEVQSGYPAVYSDVNTPVFFNYLKSYRAPNAGQEPGRANVL